jgi:BCD family chlorophyll transporter-like MFS transporter
MTRKPIGWLGIVRLGLVQSALGAIVVLTTSTLNRVMVVEMALPASLPAALVAWHYVIQLSRPRWGYGSDVGQSRTPWIICGMGVLALGALVAANATVMFNDFPVFAGILALLAFTMIGAGVAAAGTSLLALLATEVAPERRPAAASITWIMMIVGIVITAVTTGQLLDPYTPQRLVLVASGVAGLAFIVTLLAVAGVERKGSTAQAEERMPAVPFREAFSRIWHEKAARDFTVFVFLSMLAYSAQDLILEPYAGLVFGYSLGQSTSLAGIQNSGVLAGMVLVGLAGTLVRGDRAIWMRRGTIAGCLLSAAALLGLSAAGFEGSDGALQPTVFLLGFSNGVFAVSAIALMMALAGKGEPGREGLRMGVWGAAQAMAFGIGGFAGAAGLDLMRSVVDSTPVAFASVFAAEAGLFIISALLAARLGRLSAQPSLPNQSMPGHFQLGAGR